jgi:hypothetical protein
MMNFNERSSQRYHKWGRPFCAGQLRGVTLFQLVKSAQGDIAAVAVGNDESSSLLMFSFFGR